LPFISREPDSTSAKPDKALNKVVLPAPLGQINPTTSLACSSRFTLANAFKPPNETDSDLTESRFALLTRVDSRHT